MRIEHLVDQQPVLEAVLVYPSGSTQTGGPSANYKDCYLNKADGGQRSAGVSDINSAKAARCINKIPSAAHAA